MQTTLERLLYGGGYLFDVPITAGAGTSIATDQIGGANYQRVKLIHGITGVNVGDVAGANPFPIEPGLKLTEQCLRIAISFAASGDNIAIAADAVNKIRLYALLLMVDTPVSVKLGEAGPTYWTGAMRFGAGGGLLLTQQGEPHFMTSAINKSFLVNLSAAVQCSGVAWYTLVP